MNGTMRNETLGGGKDHIASRSGVLSQRDSRSGLFCRRIPSGISGATLIVLWTLVSTVLAQDFTYTVNGDSITITGYTGAGGAVIIPDTINDLHVTVIGAQAFFGKTSLTSVTIPDSVAAIGKHAFAYCTNLTSVEIGNGLTGIEDFAFYLCSSLTNITVDASNPNYSSAEGVLFDKTQTTLILYPGGAAGGYTIPDTVAGIGDFAFYVCTGLTTVMFGNSVTNIGGHAFASCSGLTNVTIFESVHHIGYGAFKDCTGLTALKIPDSVNSMEDWAFNNCASLKSVTIGNGLTIIGYEVFAFCGSLMNITIPDGVRYIASYAFSNCNNLTRVSIPESVTAIGGFVFHGCTNLTSVYFTGDAPTLIGAPVFTDANDVIVYILPGTTGWEATYSGRPTVLWNPTPQITGPSDPFGFTITGTANLVIVVEAATSLASPDWTPVSTNTLTGGSSPFSDPQWVNHPARYYRLRSP